MNMTDKEYNKIKKHLGKVEKIMGYKSGSLMKSLNIPKPKKTEPKVNRGTSSTINIPGMVRLCA